MSKEIVVNVEDRQTRIAIVEDGDLAELYIENPENKRTIGNIYLGRVRKVMPSIQAAFVDIGQEQDAFLHFSDLTDNLPQLLEFLKQNSPKAEKVDLPKEENRGQGNPADLLERGQELLVQVTKEPISNKGSRISTDLSMAGRFLVLVPLIDYVAVSRKITNEKERRRLKSLARSLMPENFGVIVRTVAEGRDAKSLDKDLKLLMERWRRIENKLSQNPGAPALVHEDVDMASSIIRDQFSDEFGCILVDDEGLYKSVRSYVQAVAPKMVDCVELHTSDTPVFEAVGIQQGADRAFKDRVELPSGGYLFIERTEAMHVVDVNSGRSGRGKSQSQNSLDVNLEAARVIAQQIRLRDLGGIIVVDFIDLRDDKARKKVYDELQQGFEDDRAVTKILPMSDFGLVEITRQRLRPSITTTFSSANGESDEDEAQAPAKQQKKGKDTRSNDLEQQKREIRRLRQEVRRLKKEANAPQASNGENDADQPDIDPEEVQALRQRVQELEHEAEEAAAAAAAAKREGADGSDTPAAPDMQPEALIEAIEAWLDDYTTSGRRRAVTLHVHPFTAAFLNRPVPSYPTRWFMRHLVRVHVEADPDVPPMAFQCRDARSGEELRTTRAAKASA